MSDAMSVFASASSDEPIDLSQVRIDPKWALRLPASLALRKRLLPLALLDGRLHVACVDPSDTATLSSLSRFFEHEIQPVPADPESLRKALNRIFGGMSLPGSAETSLLRGRSRDARVTEDDAVAICDELLQAALLRGASDIHLDPSERIVRVRFRVDGVLETYRELTPEAYAGVSSRFKVLAELDIAERRAPQDGRFSARIGPEQIQVDIRTATLPTRHGERITLRLLASHSDGVTLTSLGMSDQQRELFEHALQLPYGLVLLTGPTGSGKSTTLFAGLNRLLATRGGNVLTIEDPIEYEIQGTSQIEVDSADKVNFNKALRSILRHDPDVIMIGEIRDAETADIAMKAALTGHLVLSTLHTNTAPGVLTRLFDMGLQRYLVAATLRLAVAQRLVRKLCQRCKVEHRLTAREAISLGDPSLEGQIVYEPGGCLYCAGRGFTGRMALFEMLPLDEELSRAVADGIDEASLTMRMRQQGLAVLADDARNKLLGGLTTRTEILSATTVW